MSGTLFGRYASILLGGAELRGYRVAFRIESSDDPSANKATIQIYNLGPDARALLSEKGAFLDLDVGYNDTHGRIFRGNLTKGSHEHTGPDWVSTVTVGDGIKAIQETRHNETHGKGMQLRDIFKAVTSTFGEALGVGNTHEAADRCAPGSPVQTLTKAVTLSGMAAPIATGLAKTLGCRWSVQQGEQRALTADETHGETVVLGRGSGLLGTPQLGEGKAIMGLSLLLPAIAPGSPVQLESSTVEGLVRVARVVHTGDTFDNAWHTSFEGKLL